MKNTILTIIISVITTLVAFNFLSQESGDKLIDVAHEVLMVQEAGEPTTGDVATGAVVETGAVLTGETLQETGANLPYNPTNLRATPDRILSQ